MVDLPPPVGPTKAAICPGSISKLTSFRIACSGLYANDTLSNAIRPLKRPARRARGASRTPLSVSSTSRMRSRLTPALDTVSVIFDRSRMGLYILPRYRRNTTSAPAVNWSAMTRRAPYHSIRQVPVATMISTTGASIILMLRAARVVSTLSRLWTSNRRSS